MARRRGLLDGSHRYFARLQRGLGTLRGDISIRDVDLDDCKLDMDDFDFNMTGHGGDVFKVNVLKSKVNVLKSKVNVLKSKVNVLKSKVNVLKSKVEVVKSRVKVDIFEVKVVKGVVGSRSKQGRGLPRALSQCGGLGSPATRYRTTTASPSP